LIPFKELTKEEKIYGCLMQDSAMAHTKFLIECIRRGAQWV